MSYQVRNILVIVGFLLVIGLTGGYLVLFHYPAKIDAVKKETARVTKQIKSLDGIESRFAPLRKTLEEKKERMAKIDKRIFRNLSSADTYYYLNLILNRIGFIEFNMLFAGSKTSTGFGYNIYKIRGEGTFQKIYNLIWYLERGPFLYRITKLNLKGVESKDPETKELQLVIPFDLELNGYYADIPKLPSPHRSLQDVKVLSVRNPFRPFILRNLPPNTEGLLEVERSDLKAIVADRALIADQNGKVHSLKIGDKVYLGYLTAIDPEKNQVEFTLNKGGVVEKVVLEINFAPSKSTKGVGR